eukprot:CAMPEP_0116881056 /NCGR_PEP_ID=MMETSP0463-20121206/13119_1 /TAXON_ID=181622 /ORGANISM="Strombidinopsis sp, Strain SopsisLIS2011" /LENGTH=50 /DNA_ID=CAMNT_0004532521 /DNA_START=14 /DNA_END=166 /DNA_ORIENTATION=-
MQQEDLQKKVDSFIKKMPFIKAIILSELNDDVCIFKYIAKDLKFKNEAND